MSVAKLNVEIGATIRGLTQGLKQAEREMRQAGQRMADLGNSLSLAFTLPLAGIGISAIKAAGDIEALRLAMRATFEGAGRSIQEADAELENLRKSAMAPGLEFDQAVRASVRLQNVGFSAEKARKVIEQLANTVATTGGTAEDLGEVVNQFSQMIGKGKIFQDDLKILTGRMPKLAQIMKETFGTTTAEGLNRLGIDARTFVDTVTEKMAEMPRVSGGIANAIVNAGSAIKFSLAKVGETINRVFNVTGGLEGFSTWITGLADSFAGLSETSQKVILAIGALLLALGPMVRVTGLAVQGVLAMRAGFIALRIEAIKLQALGLIQWWKQLNMVMKANIIGVTVAVVLALAAAFALLSKDMSASAQAARAVAEVNLKASQSIAEEKVKVDLLTKTLQSETATREQKKAALQELQKISPQYFGSLKEENGLIVGLTEAYSQYINELMRSARVAAAREKLVEIEKQLLNTTEAADPSVWQTLGNAVLSVGNASSLYARQAQTMVDNSAKVRESLIAQREAMAKMVAENEMAAPVVKKTGDAMGGLGALTGEARRRVDELAQAVKGAQEEYDKFNRKLTAYGDITFSLTDRISELQGIMDKLVEAGASSELPLFKNVKSQLDEANAALKVFNEQLNYAAPNAPETQATVGGDVLPGVTTPDLGAPLALGSAIESGLSPAAELMQRLQENTIGFGEAFQQAGAIIANTGTLIQQTVMAAAEAMVQYASQGGNSIAELAKATVGAAAKVIRAYIQQGVTIAAMKALQSLPFPFNLAAAAAAGGLAATLFNKLISSIGIPALAQGGITTGPQLAMVGDNPGGREAIIPLDRLNKMFAGPDSGGGELTARITDDGLLFVLERAQRRSKRTRGF